MGSEIDREQHSLLRADWREYIKEGLGTSDSERKLRERIRNRVVTGIHDILLLNNNARSEDIKQIFERLTDQTENSEQSDIVNGADRELRDTHFIPARGLVSLAWRGLRECGIDKSRIFDTVVVRGIENGEADYQNLPHGSIESDISLNILEAHPNLNDPLERWKRDLSMSGADFQELTNRLNEHPEVESIVGEDINELIEDYLIEDDEITD